MRIRDRLFKDGTPIRNFLRKIIEIGDTNSFYVKNREVVDSVYCCFLILLLFFVKNTHNKSLLLNLANLGFS